MLVAGVQVRSFSQLRNEYAEVDTFYLNNTPMRRSRTPSNNLAMAPTMSGSNMYLYDEYEPRKAVQSARNASRQRVLSEPDLRHSSMGNHDAGPGRITLCFKLKDKNKGDLPVLSKKIPFRITKLGLF